MPRHNDDNERVKHDYQTWLTDAKGQSDATVDKALAAIAAFEKSTGWKPFRLFHTEQARKFSRELQEATNPKTGKPYALTTVNAQLKAAKHFFEWYAGQPDGRKRLSYGDTDYFRLKETDQRIARATRHKNPPTVEETLRVLAAMPRDTVLEQRNRALVSFFLLTAARIAAVRTARLKHLDLATGRFDQDAREVATKASKTFTTWFFPVGNEPRAALADWIATLRTLGFGDDGPLFPRTATAHDADACFVADGVAREGWRSDEPIRKIVASAFRAHGLPAPHPHLFRDTLVRFGQERCRTPEEF